MIRDEGTNVVVVWTTLPEDSDPAPFARTLVEERLAACVTATRGVSSVYRWNDAVEETVEHHVAIKTTAECLDRLQDRISQLHPYDLPELIVLRAGGGSRNHLGWVNESTALPPGAG